MYRRIERKLLRAAKREQPSIAVFDDELAAAPWRVVKLPRKRHSLGCEFSMERVGIVDREIGVQQLFGLFVRIRRGWLGTPEVNRATVTRDDRINRRIEPCSHAAKAKLRLVPGERGGHIDGEKHRYNLPDHLALLYHKPTHDVVEQPSCRVPRVLLCGRVWPDSEYGCLGAGSSRRLGVDVPA